MTGEKPDMFLGHIRVASDGFLASTAAVFTETIFRPTEPSVIITEQKASEPYLHVEGGRKRVASASRGGKPLPVGGSRTEVSPTFKLVFLVVTGIALLCFFAGIGMAGYWTEPTEAQKTVMAAADFGWKAGFGAIIGLLSGKVK